LNRGGTSGPFCQIPFGPEPGFQGDEPGKGKKKGKKKKKKPTYIDHSLVPSSGQTYWRDASG